MIESKLQQLVNSNEFLADHTYAGFVQAGLRKAKKVYLYSSETRMKLSPDTEHVRTIMGKYISVSDVLSHAGYPSNVRLYQALYGDSNPDTVSVSDLRRSHAHKPRHYITFDWYNGMKQSPHAFHGRLQLLTLTDAVECWLNMENSRFNAGESVKLLNSLI